MSRHATNWNLHNTYISQWTYMMNIGSRWWTGRPSVLRFMGSQRVGHDWATELNWTFCKGFPNSSVGIESTCNAGDPVLISGSVRSAGEEIGYPLQYSWASPVVQLVKNPLHYRRPGFDPWVGMTPGKGKVYPLQNSGLEKSMGSQSVGHDWGTFTFTLQNSQGGIK